MHFKTNTYYKNYYLVGIYEYFYVQRGFFVPSKLGFEISQTWIQIALLS
jgi:hypothetical protein